MDYRVAPDRLRALETELAGVLRQVEMATPTQMTIAPPGAEPVSIDAARRLGLGLALRHYEANRMHRSAIESARARFGATAAQYVASEDDATVRRA